MTHDALAKTYDPQHVESKWYAFWESQGFFTADPNSKKPAYCIVIPPPNVTGVLHMGHALVNTLQDILIRWKRMLGFEALWIPGTDHAGIATQTVVERALIATQGKKRSDFSREEFLELVWKWKLDHESKIINQLKRLGCSCDWTRQRFTMDDGNNLAVRTLFKRLFDEGLIYRGDYLVNWDPVTQTALADDEVEYEERPSSLWHFDYPLADGSGFVTIATTRPETMLGDTAVAVAPEDARYASLVGKKLLLPLMNREIPIIADYHVDPSFGSGAVKITPAHDHNDYQIGITHQLPFINIMTPDGKINSNGGPFAALSMEEARKAVVSAMQSLNLVRKIEPHLYRIGLSYRSKAVIEPYLSKQWFVKMKEFGKKLSDAIKTGQVKLIPSSWDNTYFHWIENLRDWCISRQLWWGHRIPIWYHKEDPDRILCYAGQGIPQEVTANPEMWRQDEDVLDTWFSSALWPFATLGWPHQTQELKKFYPNSVLVTGHDILFFWVARMLFMGEYATGELPFPETFLHGLIYGRSYWRNDPSGHVRYVSEKERLEYDLGKPTPSDVTAKWEKMSKTKGNVIDPIEIIGAYGTDAIRMALCASATHARQIDLDRRRFEEFKNFTNKIWNGARFVFLNLGEGQNGMSALTGEQFSKGLDETLLSLEDRWILSALTKVVKNVNAHLSHYTFDQSALEPYNFFWKEFCAYYVELAKPILFGKAGSSKERTNKQKLLAIVLCQTIRLLHPMAPFITEELFQLLKQQLGSLHLTGGIDPYTEESIKALQAPSCVVSSYPQVLRESDINPKINQLFEFLEQVVYTIRTIRGAMKLSPGTSTDLFIVGKRGDPHLSLIDENQRFITSLVNVGQLTLLEEEPTIEFSGTAMVENLKLLIPLPPELQGKEKERLLKEQEKLEKTIQKLQSQISNQEFMSKAPAVITDKLIAQLKQAELEYKEMAAKLQKEI